MRKAIYPGTFDPITNGHIDIVDRALQIFDQLVIGVAPSVNKRPVFTLEERVALAKEALKGHGEITVVQIEGLTVDFARSSGCVALVRGLRAVSDFEYEFQLAQMNRHLQPRMETIFLMPGREQFFTSSNLVRAVASFDAGRVRDFAPPNVVRALREKLQDKSEPEV